MIDKEIKKLFTKLNSKNIDSAVETLILIINHPNKKDVIKCLENPKNKKNFIKILTQSRQFGGMQAVKAAFRERKARASANPPAEYTNLTQPLLEEKKQVVTPSTSHLPPKSKVEDRFHGLTDSQREALNEIEEEYLTGKYEYREGAPLNRRKLLSSAAQKKADSAAAKGESSFAAASRAASPQVSKPATPNRAPLLPSSKSNKQEIIIAEIIKLQSKFNNNIANINEELAELFKSINLLSQDNRKKFLLNLEFIAKFIDNIESINDKNIQLFFSSLDFLKISDMNIELIEAFIILGNNLKDNIDKKKFIKQIYSLDILDKYVSHAFNIKDPIDSRKRDKYIYEIENLLDIVSNIEKSIVRSKVDTVRSLFLTEPGDIKYLDLHKFMDQIHDTTVPILLEFIDNTIDTYFNYKSPEARAVQIIKWESYSEHIKFLIYILGFKLSSLEIASKNNTNCNHLKLLNGRNIVDIYLKIFTTNILYTDLLTFNNINLKGRVLNTIFSILINCDFLNKSVLKEDFITFIFNALKEIYMLSLSNLRSPSLSKIKVEYGLILNYIVDFGTIFMLIHEHKMPSLKIFIIDLGLIELLFDIIKNVEKDTENKYSKNIVQQCRFAFTAFESGPFPLIGLPVKKIVHKDLYVTMPQKSERFYKRKDGAAIEKYIKHYRDKFNKEITTVDVITHKTP